jgi:hypothetical protein
MPVPVTGRSTGGILEEEMESTGNVLTANQISKIAGKRCISLPLGVASCIIKGVPARMLIDCGSMVNIMTSDLREKISSGACMRELPADHLRIRGFNGQDSSIVGAIDDVQIDMNGCSVSTGFYVGPHAGGYELIAGLPFLEAVDAVLFFENGTFCMRLRGIDGEQYQLPLQSSRPVEDVVRTMPAYTNAITVARAFPEAEEKEETWEAPEWGDEEEEDTAWWFEPEEEGFQRRPSH